MAAIKAAEEARNLVKLHAAQVANSGRHTRRENRRSKQHSADARDLETKSQAGIEAAQCRITDEAPKLLDCQMHRA